MCFNLSESEEDQLKAIEKGIEIMSGGVDLSGYDRLRHDKIDVTEFLETVVEDMVK